MRSAIIVAGGEPPTRELIDWLGSLGYQDLVAADGGAEGLKSLGLVPEILIGDLDSISPATLAWCQAQPRCEVIHLARQSDTDLEKALEDLVARGCERVALTGISGDRLDHLLSNLAIILRWSDRLGLTAFVEDSVLEVLEGEVGFSSSPGALISLFAFDSRIRISTKGLAYPLENETLPFGQRESISNQAVGQEVELEVRGGPIFLIREAQEVLDQGLIERKSAP